MSGANVSSVVNKKAKKAGQLADELIKQQAEGGMAPAGDDQAQAKAKAEVAEKAKAEEKNLDPDDKSPSDGAEPTPADQDWKARFQGLQVAYNRDVPKLRGELQTAYGQIDDLQGQINELKETVNKPADPVNEPVELELSDEEVEQYGPGWIAMMKKIAQGSGSDLAKQVVDLQQELAKVKSGQERIVEHAAVTDEERFFSALTKAVSNWETINNDPTFHIFLDEEVGYDGKTRRDYLDAGRASLNASTVIRIFSEFANNAPQGSSQNLDEPKPDLDVPEDMITPKNSGGGEPPVEEQKYYSTAEINKFYLDKASGKYKGKEDEARKIEKDIFAAGKQGRILSDRQAERAMKFTEEDLS